MSLFRDANVGIFTPFINVCRDKEEQKQSGIDENHDVCIKQKVTSYLFTCEIQDQDGRDVK